MQSTRVAFFVALVCVVLLCAEETLAEDKPCLRGCPRNFDPVCARQGRKSKQFGNECMWKNYNCENTHDAYPEMEKGECRQAPES